MINYNLHKVHSDAIVDERNATINRLKALGHNCGDCSNTRELFDGLHCTSKKDKRVMRYNICELHKEKANGTENK